MLINEQFLTLPEEKRRRIINAGFEVFGSNDYKRASTDLIAAKADISKGLLFYYFHNKKSLLAYLADYAVELIKEAVVDSHFNEIDDFFELCEYMSRKKYNLMLKSPYIFDFLMRSFYSKDENIAQIMSDKSLSNTYSIYTMYFDRLDKNKFKPDINPFDIQQMLIWTADGYMHEKQRLGLSVKLDDIMEKYHLWSSMLRKLSYKEELLV